jgi:FkbM family methyltransferase
MNTKPVAIYGASLFGRVLNEILEKHGVSTSFFVDEYTPHREFEKKPVYRINEVSDKSNIRLINSTAYDLIDNLRQSGFADVVPLSEIIRQYPDTLPLLNKTMWIVKSERLIDENEFAWLKTRLADDHSKDLLHKLTSFRKNPIAENLFWSDGDPFYFPSQFDAFKGIENLRFVDCGAYNGDTIQSVFKNFKRKIDWIIAMEPDPNNLTKLAEQKFDRSRPEHSEAEIFVYPLGVYNCESICSFQIEQEGASSCISTDTNTSAFQIPVARLDTLLAHAAPNFIKLDIEGAEPEALAGAKKIISEKKPNLALSIYHKAEHLWEIPRLVDSICPEYEFRLRLHGNFGRELTLYCFLSD